MPRLADNLLLGWGCLLGVGVDDLADEVASETALFGAFVRIESALLLRVAWGLTGDRGAAEDLVQAALLRVWGHWSGLRDRRAAGAYSRRVVTSLFLTSRRPYICGCDDGRRIGYRTNGIN